MTSIETLKNKLSEVNKYHLLVVGYKKHSVDELNADVTLRGAVQRYLYLLTQATIDLGEVIISFFKYRQPSTYAEIFEILFENKFITHELITPLKKMTGFRNILAHAYGQIHIEMVHQVLQKDIFIIETFLGQIQNNISQFKS